MFDLGRELKRLFKPHAAFVPPRDGLTGGDSALLELLDLDMLKAEARACDIAAGRVGAKDRPMRQLEQAAVWRELARRTGDAAALRKAASAAESSAEGFNRRGRARGWALARAEQGACAALGAELFGHDGLNAAAAVALAEAAEAADRSLACAPAVGRARIEAAAAIVQADAERAFRALSSIEKLVSQTVSGRPPRAVRLATQQLRIDHAEMLWSAGERFCDERVVERAVVALDHILDALDAAYEPLTWRRAATLHGRALVTLGELTADTGQIIEAIGELSEVVEGLTRDHSPLDWADVQLALALARALEALGEATDSVEAFERAVESYNRALVVLKRQPGLSLRAAAGVNRAMCIARRAELAEQLHSLDEAEANFRCELASADAKLDPVWWAVCQLALARIYEVRLARCGRDRGERTRALFAATEALEVFSDHGLRNLADLTLTTIDRLQVRGKVRR